MTEKPGFSIASEYKIIHDTVHGTIKLEKPFLELLETPELQRLNSIHQLGFAYLVFPGANHTRLEHSLGTYHVASRMTSALNLEPDERSLVNTAGLLHDLGHGPYSHTVEYLFNNRLGISHTDLTRDIILGNYDILDEPRKRLLQPRMRIVDILDGYSIDPKYVSNLICSEPKEVAESLSFEDKLPMQDSQQFFNTRMYLYHLIHSTIDADQIDFLLRDSHYTGVAYGVLDLARLIQTIEIFNNDLVINKSGLSAVEGMLVARTLMYSSVYFHKTVRIAELMLSRTMERLDDETLRHFITSSEAELSSELLRMGGLQGELMLLLMYRRLFKRAYYLKLNELDESKKEELLKLEDNTKRLQIEDLMAERAGVPEGHVIIDVPFKELKFSEPRLLKTDIKVKDESVKPISRYTPLANALKLRNIPEWGVMVITDKKYMAQVEKIAPRVLFG